MGINSVTTEDSSTILEFSSLNIVSAFNFNNPGKSDFVSSSAFFPSVVIFIKDSSSCSKEQIKLADIKSAISSWK